MVVKFREHLRHSQEDGVVLPTFAVVASAIFSGQSNPVFVASFGQKLNCPFLYGRTDKTVQRSRDRDLVGFEDFSKATNDAGFRVGKSPIQVEDERWFLRGHISSFAEAP